MEKEKVTHNKNWQLEILQDPLFNIGLGASVSVKAAAMFLEETPETRILTNTVVGIGAAMMATSFLVNWASGNFEHKDEKWVEKETEKSISSEQITR